MVMSADPSAVLHGATTRNPRPFVSATEGQTWPATEYQKRSVLQG